MSYGFCPECGAKGMRRERRLNGNDTCESGHTYPSRLSCVSQDHYAAFTAQRQELADAYEALEGVRKRNLELAAELKQLRASVAPGADDRTDFATIADISRRQAEWYDRVVAERDALKAAKVEENWAHIADLESVAADRYRRIQELEVECAALKTDRVALVRAWAKHVRWSMRTAYRPEELSGEDLCRDLVSETDFFQERMIEVMEERDAIKAAALAVLEQHPRWKAVLHDALADACGRPDLRWGGE